MVLQREQANPVWGKADPGEKITVTIDGQSHSTVTDADGKWHVAIDPLKAGGPYELVVTGNNEVRFKDVLAGEVWICSGQSNMEWNLIKTNNAQLEIISANYPQIRLISVPKIASQEPLDDFEGEWQLCSPSSVPYFSAVGYLFGRRIHNTLDVPVGLIDNAWGGSAAEAWIPRDVLDSDPRYAKLLQHWDKTASAYTDEIHEQKIAEHKAKVKTWEENGKKGRKPRSPRDPRKSNNRPANIYNGVLNPTIGYGIRGVIWYQGESNASRAYQYRHLFPLMIETWREQWGQGDFPFYWAQLADFREESDVPRESAWAELREAQTMTLDVISNSGQAVIIDSGEGRDIHPRNKQAVANRLARWALAQDYGYDIEFQSPRYKSMEIDGNTITLTFDHVGKGGLYAFDIKQPIGFSIAGEDRQFVWADAKISGKNQVIVSSEEVANPVSVRYNWDNNPPGNLYDRNGLPVTPFRTDDWPGSTIGKETR